MPDSLAALRPLLAERAYDAYLVPRADEHLGEYLPAHNERLRWLTGFTGSAGLAVVLAGRAALFVDGRYTVQVRGQVDASAFELHHLLEEPPVAWLAGELPAGARVACDPRLHTQQWFEAAEARLAAAGIELLADPDNLVDRAWQDRPAPEVTPALLLDERFSGESSLARRRRIGEAIAAAGADAALVFPPDAISWLLNVRGGDVPRTPVLQAWGVLRCSGELDLVCHPGRLPRGFHEHVGAGVAAYPESDGSQVLGACGEQVVLVDPASGNAWTQQTLRASGATLHAAPDPVLLPKACKNATEVAGARAAHERDGVALVRFLAWLDGEVGAGRLHDEAVLAAKLLALRSEQADFQQPSFDTISAAGPNAAMCHYNFRDGEPAPLPPDSVYLVDSGGQYLDGTTDVTRTVAIGEPDASVRRLFTLVLKGHIALDRAVFPRGTTGTHLDTLARQFLWREGCDYDHGTGHGVGAFLSVHEGPQRIAKAWSEVALQPGMIVSNEPGYYRDGAFGIRCENLVVVRECGEPTFEQPMLGFEALTLAPFDRRLVVPGLLTEEEVAWLDAYHQRVRETLLPALDSATAAWLEAVTQPIAPAACSSAPARSFV
jgi:Xaa-Pro aminopeptidase